MIKFSPPDYTELEINEVIDTLRSGWITTGPKTKNFENEISKYCNTNRTICLNSATSAMEMVLRLMGIGKGDEVITSAYTYTASCSVILHVGAKPILVDVAKDSYFMDLDDLERKITDKTKAIIPIDIAGVIADYDKVYDIVKRKSNIYKSNNKFQEILGRILILGDAAHSFGAIYNNFKSGSIADFTCFSFHAVKNLTTAEGGAITWNNNLGFDDNELYNNLQLLSLHGQSKDALAKMKAGSWEYDILYPGYKCNMTDINASLGLVQLKRYKELLNKRYSIVNNYNDAFRDSKIEFIEHLGSNFKSSCHLYLTRIKGIDENKRNRVIEKMAKDNIPTNVHYKPLPMLTAYKRLGFDINDYPNSYDQYKNEITLPLHTQLNDYDVDLIIKRFKKYVSEVF